tara:strand:+ start:1035 stop:1694 length:660 start_codon:yes stop_codon:yes gene_type:complete
MGRTMRSRGVSSYRSNKRNKRGNKLSKRIKRISRRRNKMSKRNNRLNRKSFKKNSKRMRNNRKSYGGGIKLTDNLKSNLLKRANGGDLNGINEQDIISEAKESRDLTHLVSRLRKIIKQRGETKLNTVSYTSESRTASQSREKVDHENLIAGEIYILEEVGQDPYVIKYIGESSRQIHIGDGRYVFKSFYDIKHVSGPTTAPSSRNGYVEVDKSIFYKV